MVVPKVSKQKCKQVSTPILYITDFNTVQTATVELTDGKHEFACVQLHNTLMGRGDIIKETTLEIFNTESAAIGTQ